MDQCEGIDRQDAERCPVCDIERGGWPAAGWQLHLALCVTLENCRRTED